VRADFVTAVLPVRVTGAKESSDLDRVERLLLPSFSLFWRAAAELEFLVVVPPADLQRVSARLSRATPDGTSSRSSSLRRPGLS
jgi:hypothetical protein